MYFIRLILTIFTFLFLLTACKKNEEPTIVNVIIEDTFKPPPPYIEDFPNEIGYQWTYYVTDSANNYFDTMYVEISSDTMFYNKNFTIWNYSFAIDDYSFFRCIEKNDSLVIFYRSEEGYMPGWPYIHIIFPLTVGDSIGFDPDQSRKYAVTGYDTIQLHNGNKYLAYEIMNVFYMVNDGYYDRFWYVEKIGIVKFNHKGFYGEGTYTQELISFDFSSN